MKILPFLLLFSWTLLAQDPNEVEIIPLKLTDNIYMIAGSGGNMGLMTGPEGTLLIDSQFAPLSEKIAATIKTLTDSPVKYLVNTHWHGDHTGGNENFAKAGALVIAHDNVHKRKSTEQFMQAFGRKVPAAPKAAQPIISFNDNVTLHINGEDVMVLHDHFGHTDGDAVVYFPKSNVLHMGDTYFQGKYPFVDLSSGGSIVGMIKSVNRSLFLCDDETQIIPGHGHVSNRKELLAFRDMIHEVYTRVKKAIQSGLTLEEIQAANLTREYDHEYDGGFISAEKFLNALYTELEEQ